MRRRDLEDVLVAARVGSYLAEHGVSYQIMSAPAPSSTHLAKAVVLRDDLGEFLLAVLPASHHLVPEMVGALLERRISLASDQDAHDLFPDCDITALPPIGQRYGIEVIVDGCLDGLEQVCISCGHSEGCAQLSGSEFTRMMGQARRGTISVATGEPTPNLGGFPEAEAH